MGKRCRNKDVVEGGSKKAKTEKIQIKNYSVSLTRCFEKSRFGFTAYLYGVRKCGLFGVLLSAKYPDNLELEFLKVLDFTHEEIEILKSFQQNLWRDLFKAPAHSMGPMSEANYLVVPMRLENTQNWIVDFEIVERYGSQTRRKLVEIPPELRENLVVVSRSGAKWIYIDEVTSNIRDFFKKLYGEDWSGIEQAVEKYKDLSIDQVLFEADIDCESLLGFRKINKEVKYSDVVFAKHTRSVKHAATAGNCNYFPKGTPLFVAEDLWVFHLSSTFWEQGYLLLNSLMELEFFSYTIDFAEKIRYSGNLLNLKQAMTSSAVDSLCNYEPLETLGDSIIKFLTTLDLYLQNPKSSESKMTQARNGIVSNKSFTEISRKLELQNYIRTSSLPVSSFRPAYYCHRAFKEETLEVEQLMSDGVLADFFEALVGSFYISEGIMGSAQFLKKNGVLSDKAWVQLKKYINTNEIKNICKSDIDFYIRMPYKIKELYKVPCRMKEIYELSHNSYELSEYVSNVLPYSFANKDLLKKAFVSKTVSSGNYEVLEFLGDSILDIIILCNIYSCGKFNSNELSQIKQLLVCNQNLCCISIATGLSRFLVTKEDDGNMKKGVDYKPDEIDIICDRVFTLKMPKYFGDIFEALVGAILLDSGSLEITAKIIGNFMKKQIIYAVKGMKHYLDLQQPNHQYYRCIRERI